MKLIEGGIDSQILADVLKEEEKYGSGVREMARAIENKIADSVIEAKNSNAKEISLRFDGDSIIAFIESYHNGANTDAPHLNDRLQSQANSSIKNPDSSDISSAKANLK